MARPIVFTVDMIEAALKEVHVACVMNVSDDIQNITKLLTGNTQDMIHAA